LLVSIKEEVDKSWKRKLKRFEKDFLGNSLNAAECTILNPGVSDFENEGKVFNARAF